jgi:hypothetical protein
LSGDANELGDVGRSPGKSFLFSLTALDPGIGSTGDRVRWPVEPTTSGGSGELLTALENPRERKSLVPDRTHIRIRSPR